MKKSGFINLTGVILLLYISVAACKKTDNPIKFPNGTFPDTVVNIADINSVYDDYNIALYQLDNNLPLIFSSNRKSSGGQFDLEQGNVSFTFNQSTGAFVFKSNMTSDVFYDKLINKAKTPGNDFGPYRLFSKIDGFEYFLLSSVNEAGNLDFYYLKNQPSSGTILPEISSPLPVKIMNTGSDDAYISFNSEQDTAYYSSNKDGNFDIFLLKKTTDAEKNLSSWFDMDYQLPVKPDSINSPEEDKCPFIYKQIMVFASNRPGGMGGFDLYYSIQKNGKWSFPVNFGPKINTAYDEYRPVIGSSTSYTNKYMMFSSNRPGGKGGFDLYFTGIEKP
jgi:hypothetical protein